MSSVPGRGRARGPSPWVPATLLLFAAGCGSSPISSVPPPPAASRPAPTATVGATEGGSPSPTAVPTLPAGFPIPEGAVPAPGSAAQGAPATRWTTERSGPEVYRFFVAALPDAGFVVTGLYPGGEAAAIRFTAPNGTTWLLTLAGTAPLRIEVAVDPG